MRSSPSSSLYYVKREEDGAPLPAGTMERGKLS